MRKKAKKKMAKEFYVYGLNVYKKEWSSNSEKFEDDCFEASWKAHWIFKKYKKKGLVEQK